MNLLSLISLIKESSEVVRMMEKTSHSTVIFIRMGDAETAEFVGKEAARWARIFLDIVDKYKDLP